MTEQEKQEIIAEVKASVMDEHRCVCKPIILRRYPNFSITLSISAHNVEQRQ